MMNTSQCFFKHLRPPTRRKYEIGQREVFVKYLDTIRFYSTIRAKFSLICETHPLLHTIRKQLYALPNNLKNQSVTCVRTWTRQCECISAQQIRKGHQMFCLYTRLWEEKALKEFFKVMRQRLLRHSKEFIVSAIGISVYDFNANGIKDEEITKHRNDFDYIAQLQSENVICAECNKPKTTTAASKDDTHCRCLDKKIKLKYKDDWVPYLERGNLKVWRRIRSTGIYEYKVHGTYSDVTALDFLKVQIDTEYRSKWDSTAVQLEIIESHKESGSDIVYWEMLWPRLFSNRDYVFNRRYLIQQDEKLLYLLNKSTKHPSYPATNDKFRIVEYYSCMVIRPTSGRFDKPGIEFSLTYFDNPGMNIPSSVMSWVAMAVLPDFLEKLRLAAKSYKEYCQQKGVKDIFERNNVNNEIPKEPDHPSPVNNEYEFDTKSSTHWRYFYPNYYMS